MKNLFKKSIIIPVVCAVIGGGSVYWYEEAQDRITRERVQAANIATITAVNTIYDQAMQGEVTLRRFSTNEQGQIVQENPIVLVIKQVENE